MPSVSVDEVEKVIELTNLSMSEIHFAHKFPEDVFLTALAEIYGDKIKFYFPLDKILGDITDIAENHWANSIISANLKTDIFIDSSDLFAFGNIERLAITCVVSPDGCLDEQDLFDTQMAILDLANIKSLSIQIDGPDEVIEMAKDFLTWPGSNFDAEIVSKRRRKNRPRGR